MAGNLHPLPPRQVAEYRGAQFFDPCFEGLNLLREIDVGPPRIDRAHLVELLLEFDQRFLEVQQVFYSRFSHVGPWSVVRGPLFVDLLLKKINNWQCLPL